jgi:homospermidine synthase
MIVTHGEAFGISEMLTVRQGNRVLYRPTVHYAYMPCNETLSSLHELRCRNYELQSHLRTMSDEIVGGVDTFGVLIMGHPYNSWWTGSVLSIEESRRLVRHQNATTVQVAIGVVSAIMWTIRNPNEGLCFPEDLPHDYILSIAKPYLGKFVSEPSDWTPLVNYQVFFKENPHAQPNKTDLWQFNNFLFKP